MTSDRLTFIVTVCGDSPFLERCLRSLESQTVRCPIILSTATPSVHQYRAARRHGIPLVENPRGGDIVDDWNFALGLARTPFVNLAHQDDVYLEEYAATCLALADRFPDFQAIFSNYWELAGGRLRTTSAALLAKRLWLGLFFWRRRLRNPFLKKSLVAWGNPLCAPSALLNLAALDPQPFRREYGSCLDWDLWLHLAERSGSFVYARRPLLVYRLHAASVTAAAVRIGRRGQEELSLLKRTWPDFLARALAALQGAAFSLEWRFRRS